jgi:hypothetical protein
MSQRLIHCFIVSKQESEIGSSGVSWLHLSKTGIEHCWSFQNECTATTEQVVAQLSLPSVRYISSSRDFFVYDGFSIQYCDQNTIVQGGLISGSVAIKVEHDFCHLSLHAIRQNSVAIHPIVCHSVRIHLQRFSSQHLRNNEERDCLVAHLGIRGLDTRCNQALECLRDWSRTQPCASPFHKHSTKQQCTEPKLRFISQSCKKRGPLYSVHAGCCELVKDSAAESGIRVQAFDRASAKCCCKKSVSLDSMPSKNPNSLLEDGAGQSKSTDRAALQVSGTIEAASAMWHCWQRPNE